MDEENQENINKKQAITHLLSSMGVLQSFSIARKINPQELTKITNKVKRKYKETNPKKLQKLVAKELSENTTKYIKDEVPPGLILPPRNLEREKEAMIYNQLGHIANQISGAFKKDKFSKHELCFIVTAIVNMLELSEEDFASFHDIFNKFMTGDDNNTGNDEESFD